MLISKYVSRAMLALPLSGLLSVGAQAGSNRTPPLQEAYHSVLGSSYRTTQKGRSVLDEAILPYLRVKLNDQYLSPFGISPKQKRTALKQLLQRADQDGNKIVTEKEAENESGRIRRAWDRYLETELQNEQKRLSPTWADILPRYEATIETDALKALDISTGLSATPDFNQR